MIVLSADVTIFYEKFKDLFEKIIWKHITDINVSESSPFKDCINILNNNIIRVKNSISILLTKILMLESSKVILNL